MDTIESICAAYLADRQGQVAAWESLDYALRPVRASLGPLTPEMVSRRLVREYTAQRLKDGRRPATVNKELRTLRQALSLAVKECDIDSAPHIEIPGEGAPRNRWLSPAEANALLEACRRRHIRTFILVALHTGARKGAILELTWDRVGLDQRLIMFPPPANPRTKKRRSIVPVNDTLLTHLSEIRERAVTNWVIEYAGHPVTAISSDTWRRLVKRAGIDHCTPHDLRRTCATWMVQAGIPTAKVARYLGDREEMIERVYGHHQPGYLKDAAAALDQMGGA